MRSPDRDPWPAVRGRVAPGSAQRLRPTPTQHSRLSSDTLVPRTRTPAKTAAFLSRGMIHVHNQMCQNHAPVDFYWFDVKRQLHGCPMDTVHHRQLAVGDPNDPQHQSPAGVSWSGHSLRSKDITTTPGCAHMLLSIVAHAREGF